MSNSGKKKASPKKTATTKKTVAKKKPAVKNKQVTKKKASTKKLVKSKKRSTKNDLNCFLTAACVSHYHLADNCYQLNTLRNYRDQYLLSTQQNALLVEKYYRIAPNIVKQINGCKNKTKIYQNIFKSIETACSEIEKKQFESAKQTYIDLVKSVMTALKK